MYNPPVISDLKRSNFATPELVDQPHHPYSNPTSFISKQSNLISPELAYCNDKNKLFRKFGIRDQTRNKLYCQSASKTMHQSDADLSIEQTRQSIEVKDIDSSTNLNDTATFLRSQKKADSSFYENRVNEIVKVRNKTQDRCEHKNIKTTPNQVRFPSAKRDRRVTIMRKAKRNLNEIMCDDNPLDYNDESSYVCETTQFQSCRKVNETFADASVNTSLQFVTCQPEQDRTPLLVRRTMRSVWTSNKKHSDATNSQGRSSLNANSSCISNSNYQRHQSAIAPGIRIRQTQIMNQANNMSIQLPQIKGIHSSLVLELYEAKCLDLKINPSKQQMLRFIEMMSKNCGLKPSRKLILADMGLGDNACQVIAKILKNNSYFTQLDLRKNCISSQGAKILARGLIANSNLVHIDLGCNSITGEGAEDLFHCLEYHQSITSLSLANADCYKNKNKIGNKGAVALGRLIAKNNLITMINLTDNALSQEGIFSILDGVKKNPHMLSLNISQNDLGSGILGYNHLLTIFKHAPNSNQIFCPSLEELILSNNQLTNKSIEDLAEAFNNCPKLNLKRLDVSQNKITAKGLLTLLNCLKNNTQVKLTHLYFDKSSLEQGSAQEHAVVYKNLMKTVTDFLKMNKTLQVLSLSQCAISNQFMNAIGKGLQNNEKLQQLNVRQNFIEDEGLQEFLQACHENKNLQLKILDLSSNKIKDEAGIKLANALKQVKTLEQLSLKDNSFGNEAADIFLFLVKEKTNLWKLQLDLNLIKYVTMLEIEKTCKRNKQIVKKAHLPWIKQEINVLVKKRDPQIKLDHLDKQLKDQKKQIEIGFKHVVKEEEFVHDIIQQGDGELKELEKEKLMLDQVLMKLDEELEIIDEKKAEKYREWERKLTEEKQMIEKCQEYNQNIQYKIQAQNEKTATRNQAICKNTEILKQREELAEIEKEHSMMQIIVENYEREIQRIQKNQSFVTLDKNDCGHQYNADLIDNKLLTILKEEKDLFRNGCDGSDDKGSFAFKKIHGLNKKKHSKKSKSRQRKTPANEKLVKGLAINQQASKAK